MSRTLICAIQIGTSRICAAAAWRDQIGNYEIAAIETEHSSGCVRKGCIVDVDATAAHIKSLVLKLSNRVKSADCRGIDAAYVGIGGISMHSLLHHPSMELEEGRSVNSENITSLRLQSLRSTIAGYDILGLEPNGYTLDDVDCLNPNGRTGSLLIAHHQIIIGQQRLRFGVRTAMEKAGIRLVGVIATPLSISQVLTPDEKQRGCALIDIGHSLTTVSVFANGVLQHLATIPMGGNAVTQDIAKARDISWEEAEKAKIAQEELDIVSQCRYEEIAANVLNQLELSGCKDRLAAGCVLTGGAALQRGLVQLFGERLGMSRIMARGFSGICFGLSDRKPQFSALTTMISYCTIDCESKPVVVPEQPVQPEPVKPIEPKPEPKKEEQPEPQEKPATAPKRSGLGGFLRDLFSGIED